MQAIEVEHLTKYYGDFLAVDHLDFSVERGEIFAMIGPNGAGKSTTLRLILDILKPDEGRIAVFGGVLTEAGKDKIGYLPEERGLYKNVPLIQLLVYLGQLKGMTYQDAKQRATTLLQQLDLGDHLKSKITALSKGMAQKVQFIATILHRPELIIIDEPFSGLDPVNTQILKDLLYDAAQQDGAAIVMSTHQMQQIQEMAGRMVMIAKGKRVLYGEVDDVRRQYAENAVLVVGEGEWEKLPGVLRVQDGSRKGGEVLLYLNDQTTPDDIMQAMAVGDYRVQRFEIAIPSLEEVFIRVVGGEVET
jgi:ABC-2 type transport system ATP-binding protein